MRIKSVPPWPGGLLSLATTEWSQERVQKSGGAGAGCGVIATTEWLQ